MKIRDLISEDGITVGLEESEKEAVIEYMVGLQALCRNVRDAEKFREDVLSREKTGTTAVGGGVAIPHAKSSAVRKTGLCAVTLKGGADWGSPDGVPVNVVFMIAAPEAGDEHLSLLSRLVTLLMNKSLIKRLSEAADSAEFIKILEEYDARRFEKQETCKPCEKTYRLVAVTACPTGIAHTYMAAEALTKAAENLGISIKVETSGSGGTKNQLTAEEIKNAETVIIAADRQVEMGRFNGKKLVSASTGDAIHKAEEVVLSAVSGNAPVYRHKGEQKEKGGVGATGFRALYGYLMNGVSHMLPFVVAGGLFIAVSFLIDTVKAIPETAAFGSGTPVSAFLNQIGGIVFSFMLPVLSGYISMAIADRPGFLPGFAGGWLANIGSTFANPAGDTSSGFLGAMFAGFAAGFTMLLLEAACDSFPAALEGLKSVLIYPIMGLLLITVIVCGVNPLMGYINTWISDLLHALNGVSAVALGAVLGAMMAFDMGGPVNKAAYVFGTASIATGNLSVMAAVMAGGMVPPLAIALATSIFPGKFSPEERKNGTVNYVLGLSFITEGAIPYAASDPLRVIPSSMVGAAVASGLSMLFGCTLGAPHGGVFVFPVVGRWAYYLMSVAIGSVVSALILGAVKKTYAVKGKK
ncbi:MAG: fructose-specific PTS transporter subunit EIIC [Clostridia bacterium]|nr:fructose-specific PTS transporter subunit EIIC [Clostridia bacterium]